MFIDRIQKIAGGRKLTPWLKSIGWIANDVTRINAGAVPGSGKLQQLAEAEGVNLNWLLTGVGQPFVVEHYVTDASAMRRIKSLTSAHPKLRLLRLIGSSDEWHLVVLGQATYEGDALFSILVGNLGRLSQHAAWNAAEDGADYYERTLSASEFIAVGEGRLGVHGIFNPDSGLFAPAERVRPAETLKAARPFLTPRDQLHTAIDAMSDDKAARWLALLSGED